MGGAEEYLRLLIEGLDRRKFDIRFVCTDDQALAPLISWLQSLEIEANVLRADRLDDSDRPGIHQFFHLWKFFRSHPTDILHFNLPAPYDCRFAIIAARLAGVPTIVTTNHLPTLSPTSFTWKGQLILRLAQRCVDLTIVESDVNRQAALRHYKLDPARTVSVYHGIDVKRFDRPFDREAVREELGLSFGHVIIGTVGRLTPQKAHHIFLKAAAIIKKSMDRAKFIIVGDGELRQELERQARQLGLTEDVLFTGHRHDVPELLSVFDVFALSSLYEGLPLAILEAMAMAKPIVATRVDGVPEAVVDGETGILVPPSDPTALAEAILSLLQNPSSAQAMGQAGRRRVEAMFRQDVMVVQTEQLYLRVRK
jgi:glycosyltransferase involved in cell wall biosynthesis